MIGWNLILEYAVSNMAVAVGFSAYFNDILESIFGFHLPQKLSEPMIVGGQFTGSYFNLPAFLILMILTWILTYGIKESARTNNIMVLVKLAAIGPLASVHAERHERGADRGGDRLLHLHRV